MVSEGFFGTVTFNKLPEYEEVAVPDIWGAKHSRGGDGICKGPGVGECLAGGKIQVG